MRHAISVLKFGWPFLRRYRGRLFATIFLGWVVGLGNAGCVWVTKTLFERLQPGTTMTAPAKPATQGNAIAWAGDWARHAEREVAEHVDPWLPKQSRPLDTRQIAGVLLLLPLVVAFRGYASYLATYCSWWVTERVSADLRLAVFEKLSTLSLD